jgi:hypothetical protein
MTRRIVPMKDVVHDETRRRGVCNRLNLRCPNGETRYAAWRTIAG